MMEAVKNYKKRELKLLSSSSSHVYYCDLIRSLDGFRLPSSNRLPTAAPLNETWGGTVERETKNVGWT